MTTSLIIGAGGQMGGDLAAALRRVGHDVWLADLQEAAKASGSTFLARAGIDLRSRWEVMDATDVQHVQRHVEKVRPDRIFHLAAILSATGERDPVRCWDVNTDSLFAVLQAAARLSKARGNRTQVFFPSSIAAFGRGPQGFSHGPIGDDYPLFPETTYGATKAAGEALGSNYAVRHGVDFRSLRFPGLLNAARPGGGSTDYANEMYLAAAEGARSVDIDVRPDTRVPFMHMDDAVAAMVTLMEAPEDRLTRRTYNVTSFSPTAEEIAQSVRSQSPGLEVRFVAEGPRQANLDSWPQELADTRAREDWGYRPQYDLEGTTRAILAALASQLAQSRVAVKDQAPSQARVVGPEA
jgi:threonine 3-dehydrogenase